MCVASARQISLGAAGVDMLGEQVKPLGDQPQLRWVEWGGGEPSSQVNTLGSTPAEAGSRRQDLSAHKHEQNNTAAIASSDRSDDRDRALSGEMPPNCIQSCLFQTDKRWESCHNG